MLWVLGFVHTKKINFRPVSFHLASGWPAPNPPLRGDGGAEFPKTEFHGTGEWAKNFLGWPRKKVQSLEFVNLEYWMSSLVQISVSCGTGMNNCGLALFLINPRFSLIWISPHWNMEAGWRRMSIRFKFSNREEFHTCTAGRGIWEEAETTCSCTKGMHTSWGSEHPKGKSWLPCLYFRGQDKGELKKKRQNSAPLLNSQSILAGGLDKERIFTV